MPKNNLTPDIIEGILARIPEGFIHQSTLAEHFQAYKDAVNQVVAAGKIGREGKHLYDPTRLTLDDMREYQQWATPSLPRMRSDLTFVDKPILERRAARERQLDRDSLRVIRALQPTGYAETERFPPLSEDGRILRRLLEHKILRQVDSLIFDPLYLSESTVQHLVEQRYGTPESEEILVEAEDSAKAWEALLPQAGDVLRSDAQDGPTPKDQVLARTYTLRTAAKRLGAHVETLEHAIEAGHVASFVDPGGQTRFPAAIVETALSDPEMEALFTGFEPLSIRAIALVSGLRYSNIYNRLAVEGINRAAPTWGEVRGKWGLPDTLREFREILREKRAERRIARRAARFEKQERFEQQRRHERERRASLRARLVAAFPDWKHEGRIEQQLFLHLGPPNSGKTHDALNALVDAGSGWYLGPLRLLAFEVFDRLNERGVACSLLTGEEYIPVPGARITAATVEMFNPLKSGQCVVIDEAQMLADPDRGWAWTRAFMEAQAPEIHLIGPPTARQLIEKLASAAAMPLKVIEHERLAPIQVARQPWPLTQLPPRTILVAFSRRTVLDLKYELERMKRRVSVIYGNLPPEVRRRQSDRFAAGETDICVATDAVGMGLNLPADYVCFYEVEKFDGQEVRLLTPAEVQQIGGRAGRYGISTAGEVGAGNKRDLAQIDRLFHSEPAPLTHARIAPTVDDLAMLPGSLADKLEQWASLESIPDALRSALKTADLSEQVELARMLTNQEVDQLGLGRAMKLVSAPTRENIRFYWRACASAILAESAMPLPPSPPERIRDDLHLEETELSITCADVYLWLSQRQEFQGLGPDAEEVREARAEWSANIDAALLRRLEAAKRCARCGRRLPTRYRYSVCNDCYYGRYDDSWP